MNMKHIGLGIGTLALLTGTTVWAITQQRQTAVPINPVANTVVVEDDDGDDEVLISVADLPASVRTSLASIAADSAVTQVSKKQEGGTTTYDVEYTKSGKLWAAEFSATGTVQQNELDDEDGDND